MRTTAFLIGMLSLALGSLRVAAQVTETHSFINLNKSIPDGNAAGLSDVQTVSSAIGTLASVRLKLHLAGEFNGDLYAYVRHVGTSGTNFCLLLNRVGRTVANSAGYADAGLEVTFEGAAAQGDIHTYHNVTNPPSGTALAGTWQPDGRNVDPDVAVDTTPRSAMLSGFTGTGAGGVWTLYVVDLESGGTNLLVSWELEFTGVATPTVTWATPGDMVYGPVLGEAQLNAASPVPGTFAYNPPAGTVLTAGSNQTLSATFTPTDTSSYASVVTNVSINVLKKSLTITATNQTKTYGQAVAFAGNEFTPAGLVNSDTVTGATLSSTGAAATAAVSGSPYGITPSAAVGTGLANYTISYVPGTLTVNPAALTITAADKNKIHGEADPAFSVSYAGFITGENQGVLGGTLSLNRAAGEAVGDYTITAAGQTSGNYAITYHTGTLSILPAATTGVVSASANPAPPGQLVTLTLTLGVVAPGAGTPTGNVQFRVDGANAGAPVVLSGGAASYFTSTLAHGTHTVVAEYAGDGNFTGTTNSLASALLINTPPVAGGNTINRNPTSGVKVTVAMLLSNDNDADSDVITFLGFSANSANGGTVVSNGGWVFYTPPPGFTNADAFTYTIGDGFGVPVTGVVTVNIRVDNGPSQNLVITVVGNGAHVVRGSGIPNRTYRIQFAEDADNPSWQTLGTATADPTGIFEIVDAAESPQRFYRSVYP